MAVKSGEADMGLAFGVEKLSGAGLLSGGQSQGGLGELRGRLRVATGRSLPVDGRIGTEIMPGVFAQIGMEYGHKYGGTSFELFARISREEPFALDPQPPGRLHQEDVAGADHGRRDDRLPQHPTHVLGQLRRGGGRRGGQRVQKLKTLSLEQQKRAVKISASILTTDPWEEACQILPDVNTLTRNAATPGLRASRDGTRPTSIWSSSTTASPPPSWCTTTTSMLCEQGGAVDFFNSGATWRDGTTPVNVSGGLESKGHPIAATGIANVWEVATHLRGEAGSRQIEGAKVGLTHVIGLGSACGVHILEKSAA